MAKEILDEIIAAEEQAKGIINEAKNKASEILQKVHAEKTEIDREAEEKAAKKVDSILFAARQKAEALKDKARDDGDKTCSELETKAQHNKKKAIEKIIQEFRS